MEISTVHRADDRDLNTLRSGFQCYNGEWALKNNVENARSCLKKRIDPDHDISKLPDFPQEVLKPVPIIFKKGATKNKTLIDVMATIKRVLKDYRAFWVSTSVNQECGGMKRKHKYKIDIPTPLKQYQIVNSDKGNSLMKIDDRTDIMIPSICLDSDLLDSSKIIAINSGPIDDAEISFLTSIPKNWITDIT